MTGYVRRYLLLIEGAHGLLVASLLASITQAALLIPIPLVLRHVFDTDLHRGDAGGVAAGGALVLVLYLASSVLGFVTRFTVLKTTKGAIARLRCALLEKIYALPQSFHDRHDSGELHATIVQDSERLDVVANAFLGQLLPQGWSPSGSRVSRWHLIQCSSPSSRVRCRAWCWSSGVWVDVERTHAQVAAFLRPLQRTDPAVVAYADTH